MIHLFQEGGIGDLIVSCAVIDNLFKQEKIPVKLYTFFPEIASHLLPWIEADGNVVMGNRYKREFDFFISITDMVFFHKKDGYVLPEFLQSMYECWLEKSKEWDVFLRNHPFKANEMAKRAVLVGQTRWTLPFLFLGEEYKPYKYPYTLEEIKAPQKFITIHDGFDATGNYKFFRSTKSWNIESWNNFIGIFKEEYPDIAIVQLGGVKTRKTNADINLSGYLSFETTLKYLNSSLVHIDGDSGLVHARRMFKKPSVVLFGPTNHKYFGYHENINISPNFCGDCWWINRDWMENCKEKYSTPKCMDSITPESVFQTVKNMIK